MKKMLMCGLLGLLCVAAWGQNMAQRKLQMAEYYIQRLYVEEVDENKLVEDAIKKMVGDLDPHSAYTTAEETKRFKAPLQGNFDGIGVQFQMIEDTLLVLQTVSGGPSEKVGILAGDRIVRVNDTLIAGVKMTTEDIMNRLRGKRGTLVRVKVLRRGLSELLTFDIKRDKIPVYSLDAAYMLTPKVGYIRINRFATTTHDEFMEALRKLKSQGMADLVLDLQGNGGGYLEAAIKMANELLPGNELIVYTEGRATGRQQFNARGNGRFTTGRLVVLVDEYSASASEIVSGAVQDWDRGIIVGRRTFGKGLVQRAIELPDGSEIRLTVARYYTPTGRCIQKPYTIGADSALVNYSSEILQRYNRGELMHADSIHFPDSLRYKTLRLQRVVYGGGGVMPDYFSPIDTTLYTPYLRKISALGVVIKTSTSYVEKNRSRLLKLYPDIEAYANNFEVDEVLLDRLRQDGTQSGVAWNEKEYNVSKPFIKDQLKALVARDLFNTEGYYYVYNRKDPAVQQALRILSDGTYGKILAP